MLFRYKQSFLDKNDYNINEIVYIRYNGQESEINM